MLTIPDEENGAATDRLLRPYFGMRRFEWSDDDSVEFHLPHGEMLALLRQSGLVVEQLFEIRPARRLYEPLSVHHPRLGATLAL